MQPTAPRWLPPALDLVVFLAGAIVAVIAGAAAMATILWPPPLQVLGAIALVVILSRFPLVLGHRAGDAVIGFEASALVFLAVTYPTAQALSAWAVAMLIAHGLLSGKTT